MALWMSGSNEPEWPLRTRSQVLEAAPVHEVSCPGDMSVASDHHGRGIDLAKDRKLPRASMLRVDQPGSIRPRRNVETAEFTEVEEHGFQRPVMPCPIEKAENPGGRLGFLVVAGAGYEPANLGLMSPTALADRRSPNNSMPKRSSSGHLLPYLSGLLICAASE